MGKYAEVHDKKKKEDLKTAILWDLLKKKMKHKILLPPFSYLTLSNVSQKAKTWKFRSKKQFGVESKAEEADEAFESAGQSQPQ